MAALPPDPLAWRVRLLSGVVLLVIFVTGGLAGMGLTRWLAPPLPALPPPLQAYRQLGLSPEQEAQVNAIFERHRPEVEAVLREAFPRVRAINQQVEAQVRETLTPEQRKKLDAMKAARPPRGPGFLRPGMGPPGMGPPGMGPPGMEPPGMGPPGMGPPDDELPLPPPDGAPFPERQPPAREPPPSPQKTK